MKKRTGFATKQFFILIFVIVLIALGLFLYKNNISADISTEPTTIPSGWSMIDGPSLGSISLSKILEKGILVYSYNDSNTSHPGWIYVAKNCQQFKIVQEMPCLASINLNPSLSYLVYNKNAPLVFSKISDSDLSSYQNGYRTGWHILSWNESDTTRADFLKRMSLKRSNNSINSADYMIDQKLISSSIFQEERSSNGGLIFKSLGNLDNTTNTSKLNKGNAWVYFYGPNSSIKQISSSSNNQKGNISFGLVISPAQMTTTEKDNVNFAADIQDLKTSLVRFVNFDNALEKRNSDLARAREIKITGNDLMGFFVPQGNIQSDRKSTVSATDSEGKEYTSNSQVIRDISIYSGYSPDGGKTPKQAPQWDKLKTLLTDQYFKGIVIPRLNLYKDTIKYWQQWNEPDGVIGSTNAGIPAEALALLTTGQVKTSSGIVSFGSSPIVGLDSKEYSLERGVSGLIKDICTDCTFVSTGFYRNVENYYTKLRDNNYIDYVDANEIHLNLSPSHFMGYTRYYDHLSSALKIYDWLCGGRDNCQKPLYSVEIGSPANSKFIDQPEGKSATGFTMTFTENFQADDMIKRLVSLSARGLSKLGWNGFTDSHLDINGRNCPDTLTNGFYQIDSPNNLCNHPLKGLYSTVETGGFAKKLSYMSYKTATGKLSYASKIETLRRGDDEHTDVDPIFLYKITDTDGKQKFSAWCEPFWDVKSPTSTEPHPEIYKDWNYEERKCDESINLNDYGLTGKAIYTSRDGTVTDTDANNVPLTKSPIFIEAK